MKLYSQTPFAKPATHVHLYAWKDMLASTVESVHAAPFWHGLLEHSSTSMLQLPMRRALTLLSVTVHSVVNSAMKSYSQTPFAKPATHMHRYA